MTKHPEAAESEVKDGSLLSSIAKQDRKAFETLYRRYYSRLFHFAVRMVRRDDAAEEIVDDVMFAVWRGAATFEGGSSVSTWLFGIAYRQALKSLEKGRKHQVVDSDEEALMATVDPDPGADPEAVAITNSDGELLQQGIDSLSNHHRAVVELTALGHSYSEIAEVLGCPENTVKTRMFHARQQLKRFLADAELTAKTYTGTKRSWTQDTQAV